MPITDLAYTTSDNAPGGAVLTFAFLIILFAIVATVLYILLFSRPHPRVPARRLVYSTAGAGAPATPGAARDITPGATGGAADGTGRVTGGSGNETSDGTEGSE